MSKSKSASKISLKSFDDLFQPTVEEMNTHELTQNHIVEIPVSCLIEFENHPYLVVDDDKMHDFITRMIHEVKQGDRSISENDAQSYETEYSRIISEAMAEYEKNAPSKYYRDGYNLAKRMQDYQHNHLLFLRHPEVDYTDNLSERLLRIIKRKLKQAVTFRSSKSVEYLCDALSVIETDKANGKNIYNTVSNIFA